MSFFISDAMAEPVAAAGAQQADPMGGLLMVGLFFVAFYFIAIRPQAKKAKEHKAMVLSLTKGDEVITTGGLYGKITEVGEEYLQVQLTDTVEVKLQRAAIASLLPKGTIKSL